MKYKIQYELQNWKKVLVSGVVKVSLLLRYQITAAYHPVIPALVCNFAYEGILDI